MGKARARAEAAIVARTSETFGACRIERGYPHPLPLIPVIPFLTEIQRIGETVETVTGDRNPL
jgi:hypothetical protein